MRGRSSEAMLEQFKSNWDKVLGTYERNEPKKEKRQNNDTMLVEGLRAPKEDPVFNISSIYEQSEF